MGSVDGFIRNVFHDLLHTAGEDTAENLDSMGADAFVAFEAGDLCGTDAMRMNQGVLCHILLAHGIPQPLIRDHLPARLSVHFVIDTITEIGV